MTAMTSMVPAVTDYLVTTCQASALLGAATPPVVVLDGPDVTADVRVSQRLLWIGYSPASPATAAGVAQQDWPNLDHARTLDEQGEITCAAECWSGDTVIKTSRDGCAAIVAAVSQLLRGTPVSSGPGDTTMGGLVFWSRLSAWEWTQQQDGEGAAVLCVFKVSYYARLSAS